MNIFAESWIGRPLTDHSAEPITRERIIAYAGASGDYNPMHVDEVANVAAGMGGVFAHGMLGTGFAGRMVTDFLGDIPLTSLTIRCTEIVRPGDELHVEGHVSSREVRTGTGILSFRLQVKNQYGVVTHVGTATAEVPLAAVRRQRQDEPNPLVGWRAIG